MKTIRKFFDTDGNLVDESKATTCHELVVDDSGKVQSDNIYKVRRIDEPEG